MSSNVAGYGNPVCSADVGTKALTKRGVPCNKCSYLDRVAAVLGAAMLVIGILSLTGHLSGVVAGGCAAGLAVTLALYAVLRPGKKWVGAREILRERIVKAVALIGLLAIATIASLVAAGVLPKMALGIAVVTPFGLSGLWFTLSTCVKCCRKGLAKLNPSKQPTGPAHFMSGVHQSNRSGMYSKQGK